MSYFKRSWPAPLPSEESGLYSRLAVESRAILYLVLFAMFIVWLLLG